MRTARPYTCTQAPHKNSISDQLGQQELHHPSLPLPQLPLHLCCPLPQDALLQTTRQDVGGITSSPSWLQQAFLHPPVAICC